MLWPRRATRTDVGSRRTVEVRTALPRRGSRNVRVNGRDYRWLILKKTTYVKGAQQAEMGLSVQSADTPRGQALLFRLGVRRPDTLSRLIRPPSPGPCEGGHPCHWQDGWHPQVQGFAHVSRFRSSVTLGRRHLALSRTTRTTSDAVQPSRHAVQGRLDLWTHASGSVAIEMPGHDALRERMARSVVRPARGHLRRTAWGVRVH